MSKKNKFDPTSFLNDLLKDVELSDAEKAHLTTLITSNEKLQNNLGESAMRQSDYSRQIAEVKQLEDANRQYHSELTKWKQEREQEILNVKAEAEAYKRRLAEEGVIPESTPQPN